MIGVDTNLLIYAHLARTPEHRAARSSLDGAARDSRGWGLTVTAVSEFWSFVTRPSSLGEATATEEAAGFIGSLIDQGGAELWQPGPGFGARLLQMATARSVVGTRIYDLQIALTAWENGATEIWTHDRSFASVPGLIVRDPLAPPN